MKILLPDDMTPASLQWLRERAEVHYDPTLGANLDTLLPALADADAIIVRNRIQVRGKVLAGLVRCRAVGRLGVGLDNIDLETCSRRGIEVIPATGQNAASVAEWVIASAMILLRGCFFSTAQVQAGMWPRAGMNRGREIRGKTLGIVGYGSIGRATAQSAQALGMQVLACSRRPDLVRDIPCLPLQELLARSDIVSLHLPLTPATRNLIDVHALAKMKPGAILINAARGGVVDESALADALRSGHLAGAAVDVFSVEPLPAASALADAPNLLLTPHIAATTQEAENRVCDFVARGVLQALEKQHD